MIVTAVQQLRKSMHVAFASWDAGSQDLWQFWTAVFFLLLFFFFFFLHGPPDGVTETLNKR